MFHVIKFIFRTSAWIIGTVALVLTAGSLFEFYRRPECTLPVTEDGAKLAIEDELRQDRNSVVMSGTRPEVVEILLDASGSVEPRRVTSRMFKFRLVDATPDHWGYAIYDACGFVELAGDFTGKISGSRK